MSLSRKIGIAAGIVLLLALYLGNLTTMGLILPDEPRYADIGRAMAETGDWITPRLWGSPWFEKPALLYWMIAAGFKLRLGPELAPRLPVALLSVGFLAFFWFRLRHLFGVAAASYAAAMLSTSVGWLAYSQVAITDIPMAVLFSAALLLALERESTNYTAIAAFLGLATLAKSLPPLVLFLPVLALDYRRRREWLRPAPLLAFLAISLPWHILCTLQNGREFLQVLFVEHQLGRFSSTALQHGQPWWYYGPVLLLLLYPWFPLLPVMTRDRTDPRVRTLFAVVFFGFVFLSAAVNKLPSYVLPLMPAVCVLIGIGLARAARPSRLIAVCIALPGLLPPAASLIPAALSTGIRSVPLTWSLFPLWLMAGMILGGVVALAWKRQLFPVAAVLAACALLWFQIEVFPAIDRLTSARSLWNSSHPQCAPPLRRTVLYSLYYYARREMPVCDILDEE